MFLGVNQGDRLRFKVFREFDIINVSVLSEFNLTNHFLAHPCNFCTSEFKTFSMSCILLLEKKMRRIISK